MSHLVTYECGHTAEFSEPVPMVGDTVFCLRCNADAVVADSRPEWRIQCTGCTYGRKFGVARLTAEVRAAKHANQKGHRVRLYNGRNVVRLIGTATEKIVFNSGAEPPF